MFIIYLIIKLFNIFTNVGVYKKYFLNPFLSERGRTHYVTDGIGF